MGNKSKKTSVKELSKDVSKEVAKEVHATQEVQCRDDKGEKLSRYTLKQEVSEHFSGPLPHPKILGGYDNICPGAADRIINMAEKQMNHRHAMEETFLRAHSRNSLLGIWAAFILGAIVIVGGIVCVVLDKQVSGLLLGGSGLGTIVFAFIKGTKMNLDGKSDDEIPVETT